MPSNNCIQEAIDRKGFYFIAEIGQNHQGDVGTFKKLIDVAKEAGADAVKTAKRDLSLMPEKLAKMQYINPNSFGETYGEHRAALELSDDQICEVSDYAEDIGMDFGMSFTDIPSLEYLYDFFPDFVKVPSSQLTNIEALEIINASASCPVVISTGMSDSKQVDEAVEVFKKRTVSKMMAKTDMEPYLMQCTSSYPTKEENLNLSVISAFKKKYGPRVGFSGHHVGIDADMVARALGAVVFERHITLSHSSKGTDHAMSLEPDGLKKLIRNLSRYDKMLGDDKKRLLDCEHYSLKKLRDLEYA